MRYRKGWIWIEGSWGRTGRNRGRENHIKNILCEEKKILTIEGGKKDTS